MKLIIQIPCLNEEKTLPATLADLPRETPGFDLIEWLVVDDGSTDRTVEIARRHGVDHVVSHTHNRGLAAAFQTGLNAALQLGADVIVNTDADNQYPARYIARLVAPLLAGEADVVIADRQTRTIGHFSPAKKLLHRLGSAVVRWVSGTMVPDAPSGFRAMTREAALRTNVLTGYTYTLETIIQAGKKDLTVQYVPIETNAPTRDSRLIKSNRAYVLRSAGTILRLFALYEPLRTFAYVSVPFFLAGIVLWARYVYLIVTGNGESGAHVASVILGAVSVLVGFLVLILGVLADIIGAGRRIQDEVLYHAKRLSLVPKDSSSIHETAPARGHVG